MQSCRDLASAELVTFLMGQGAYGHLILTELNIESDLPTKEIFLARNSDGSLRAVLLMSPHRFLMVAGLLQNTEAKWLLNYWTNLNHAFPLNMPFISDTPNYEWLCQLTGIKAENEDSWQGSDALEAISVISPGTPIDLRTQIIDSLVMECGESSIFSIKLSPDFPQQKVCKITFPGNEFCVWVGVNSYKNHFARLQIKVERPAKPTDVGVHYAHALGKVMQHMRREFPQIIFYDVAFPPSGGGPQWGQAELGFAEYPGSRCFWVNRKFC